LNRKGVEVADRRGLGIDVGGSAIKAGLVDLDTGVLVGPRKVVATPHPSTPAAVAESVAELVPEFAWGGSVGVALPAVIKSGTAYSAANIDATWVKTDAATLFTNRLARSAGEVAIVNDADAAGLAERRHGRIAGVGGVAILLTFGTGIGSALFLDGRLVPNTEFGHIEVDGLDAERRAAAAVKDDERLSWADWAGRVSHYLSVLEKLVWPDLIVVGGGVSRDAGQWLSLLDVRTEVMAAELCNDAGIVGAAAAVAETSASSVL
jgi:polyphosphate glucokinase